MSLLALPLEMLLEVVGYLELPAYVSLGSCNRFLHTTLQVAQLSWLVTNLPKKKRDRPTPAAPVLSSANAAVLGHALRHIVQVAGTSRPMTQELLKAGASFASVACGDFLEHEFRANGASLKMRFAIAHGASMRSVPCGLETLLEDTLWTSFANTRATWLLQHISIDEIPGGLDQYMARLVKRAGATRRSEFMIAQGAEPPDRAEYMDREYRKRGVGQTLFDLFARGGYPLSEDRMGELLLWASEHRNRQTYVKTVLDQGAAWSMVPGGVNGVLETALYKVPPPYHQGAQLALLLSHGASLDLLPKGMAALLRYLFREPGSFEGLTAYSNPTWSTSTVMLLLDNGVTLETIPNGWGKLLRSTFLRHGPGAELDHIENHFGVPFDRVEGGLQSLLAELLVGSFRGMDRICYVVQRGADPAVLPKIHNILEDAVRRDEIGMRRSDIGQFLLSHGADLKQTPSGLQRLFYDTFHARVWEESLSNFLVQQGADPRKIWDGLQYSVVDFAEGAYTQLRLKWLAAQVKGGRTEGDATTG